MKEKLFILAVTLILFFGGWLFFYAIPSAWCGLKASDIGVSKKYTLVSGCLFSTDEAVWVRDENFRVIGNN